MPDKYGTRYLRTRRRGTPGDPKDSGPGVLYRRVHTDGSGDEVWWPDSLATFNPTGRKMPGWVARHIAADDWDGGNR